MPGSHLTKTGLWRTCHFARCERINHINLSVAEIKALPWVFIEQLVEIFDPPTEITRNGDKYWYRGSGKSHRDYDMPATISANGTRIWYQAGYMHRDHDRPARILADGTQEWMQHGVLHREPNAEGHFQPARIKPNGSFEFYTDGWRIR